MVRDKLLAAAAVAGSSMRSATTTTTTIEQRAVRLRTNTSTTATAYTHKGITKSTIIRTGTDRCCVHTRNRVHSQLPFLVDPRTPTAAPDPEAQQVLDSNK